MTAKRSEQANRLREACIESVRQKQPQQCQISQGGKLRGRFVAVNGKVMGLEVEPV